MTLPQSLEELEGDEALLPPAPWELWTSNSFRRITGPDGKDGGVLSAYRQRSDGHPDLSMPEDQLFALVRLRNALPGLLARIRELEEGVKLAEMVADDLIRLAEDIGEREDMHDGPCEAEMLCGSPTCDGSGCLKDKADRARALLHQGGENV